MPTVSRTHLNAGADQQPSAGGAELMIDAAWYGEYHLPVFADAPEAMDVTAAVRAMVRRNALRLNVERREGYFNNLFGDPAPHRWKKLAIRYRFGREGEEREFVGVPESEGERFAVVLSASGD